MCRQTFQLQKGLAINDAHIQKFVDIVSRRREEMIEEGVAEDFVNFDEPMRQNTDSAIERQQIDTVLDEDFLLRWHNGVFELDLVIFLRKWTYTIDDFVLLPETDV